MGDVLRRPRPGTLGAATFGASELMRLSLAAIDNSGPVVVELSEKGVGVGIEAGCAYARQIPVITLARRGADISDTLRGISAAVPAYSDLAEVEAFLAEFKEVKDGA